MQINVTFYLLQINQLVTKLDELLTLDVHSTSVPIERYSLHKFGSKERSLHGEFYYKQGNWQRNNPVSVYNECITTLQGLRHVFESTYNLISLGALQEEVFSFSSEGDLMEVSKESYVKFQAERVGNVYML